MIYLLHFDGGALARRGTRGARHYLGYCADGEVERRLAEHRAGKGARITAAASRAGLALVLVKTWAGDRARERHCAICRDVRGRAGAAT